MLRGKNNAIESSFSHHCTSFLCIFGILAHVWSSENTQKGRTLTSDFSMTGSAQHQLTKWLTSLLQSVLQNLSSNCVSDSFTFVKEVRKCMFSSSIFLRSFVIFSLFTNAPPAEAIEICADALYIFTYVKLPFTYVIFTYYPLHYPLHIHESSGRVRSDSLY